MASMPGRIVAGIGSVVLGGADDAAKVADDVASGFTKMGYQPNSRGFRLGHVLDDAPSNSRGWMIGHIDAPAKRGDVPSTAIGAPTDLHRTIPDVVAGPYAQAAQSERLLQKFTHVDGSVQSPGSLPNSRGFVLGHLRDDVALGVRR